METIAQATARAVERNGGSAYRWAVANGLPQTTVLDVIDGKAPSGRTIAKLRRAGVRITLRMIDRLIEE